MAFVTTQWSLNSKQASNRRITSVLRHRVVSMYTSLSGHKMFINNGYNVYPWVLPVLSLD